MSKQLTLIVMVLRCIGSNKICAHRSDTGVAGSKSKASIFSG